MPLPLHVPQVHPAAAVEPEHVSLLAKEAAPAAPKTPVAAWNKRKVNTPWCIDTLSDAPCMPVAGRGRMAVRQCPRGK